MVEIARELELEVEPEDVTELLQSHDKTFMGEDLLFIDQQRIGSKSWSPMKQSF